MNKYEDSYLAQIKELRHVLGEIDYICQQRRIGGPTMDGHQAYSSPYFGQIRELIRGALE